MVKKTWCFLTLSAKLNELDSLLMTTRGNTIWGLERVMDHPSMTTRALPKTDCPKTPVISKTGHNQVRDVDADRIVSVRWDFSDFSMIFMNFMIILSFDDSDWPETWLKHGNY